MRDLPARVKSRLTQKLDVNTLAKAAAMTPRTFARQFELHFRTTPARWVQSLRVEAARVHLSTGQSPLKAIARAAGFRDEQALRRAFVQQIAMTPKEYRDRFGMLRFSGSHSIGPGRGPIPAGSSEKSASAPISLIFGLDVGAIRRGSLDRSGVRIPRRIVYRMCIQKSRSMHRWNPPADWPRNVHNWSSCPTYDRVSVKLEPNSAQIHYAETNSLTGSGTLAAAMRQLANSAMPSDIATNAAPR